MIDAAVHEPETVGRANDGVNGQVEDRPAVDGHVGQIAAMPLPGVGEIVFNGSQHDLQDAASTAER